jgi:hypothetical protein
MRRFISTPPELDAPLELSHALAWYALALMKRAFLIALTVALASCGGSENKPAAPVMAKNPLSVRGWILDIEGGGAGTEKTVETEVARLTQMFEATNIWIDNAPFVSGGVAETGAFILLDVPPGNVTISFNAPGAETARLTLQNIPGSADVIIPGVLLKPNGSTIPNPAGIRVRIPGRIAAPRPTGAKAIVGGHEVPVTEEPLSAFNDRRDYPDTGGLKKVATYK